MAECNVGLIWHSPVSQCDEGRRRGVGASAGRGRLVRGSEALEQARRYKCGIDVHVSVVVAARTKQQPCLVSGKQNACQHVCRGGSWWKGNGDLPQLPIPL